MRGLVTAIAIFLTIGLGGCFQKSDVDLIEEAKNGIVIVESNGGADMLTGERKPFPSLGTGFFIDENIIITNAHVVNESDDVNIYAENNSTLYDVNIKHIDKVADIAILELVDPAAFKRDNQYDILEFADNIRAGETVFAIGHPNGNFYSVSKGLVSFVGRKIDPSPRYMVQTDALIMQGNSGGPLINTNGEVVGINVIVMDMIGGSLAYSIAAPVVEKVINDFNNYGEVRWATLGVSISKDTTVNGVIPNSSAEMSGIKTGDKIKGVTINNIYHATKEPWQLINLLGESDYESNVVLNIVDVDGNDLQLNVDLQYKNSDHFIDDMFGMLNNRGQVDPEEKE